MADLKAADFAAYFEAIHGAAPFPWQARLLDEVAREGKWPGLLDLPTGTGKTATIDVALFHLALDPAKAPRRIVLVVDRRTVVDQAFERATKIRDALTRADRGVLKKVADRLRSLSGTAAPLSLAQLRGGMPRDDAWARRPDQPVVAVSTVDQVGSRLLFRGYGVSDAMRPIHAGLLGNDTLVLLDEVHLSQPFRETLSAIRGYRGWSGARLPDRWQVVEMSATPGAEARPTFALDKEDRRDERLARRLRAKKPVQLGEPAKRGTFAEACAGRAADLAEPGRVVGVVVNRVATAREVFTEVRKRRGQQADVFLVTGRMRPLERDDLDAEIRDRVRSGRRRDAGARPVVVVSTQCIEAGADFDFDALVTECASLDALRQRFGRLNRLGEIADAEGLVLVRAESLGKDPDPIYGEALAATWRWLNEAPRDFGIAAMERALPKGDALTALLAPSDHAPVMLPAHLDLWAQTRPVPRPDPDVALWLHGIRRPQEPEVQVVWRADVTEALLAKAREDKKALEALLARVEVCPPVALEALSLPVHAVRAWLRDEAAVDVADVEHGLTDETNGKPRAGRPALAVRGDESEVIGPDQLYRGLTIIVPSTYGGIADRAWDPSSKEPVPDLGDRARWQQTRRPTLRLHPAVIDPTWPKVPALAVDEGDTDDREAIERWLDAMPPAPDAGAWWSAVRDALARSKRRRAIVRIDGIDLGKGRAEPGYLALVGRSPVRDGEGGDVTTEDDGASHTGVEVKLHNHMKGVATWAKDFAERCGLPAEVVRDVEIAGRWHDAGKVDPRFQRMLHGGSAYKAEVAEAPLAKSGIIVADRAARARARKRSGYPEGARHELASVALLAAHAPLLAEASDRDLVLHLVASHHGWCRPFAPVAPDREPVELALDTGAGVVRVSSDHGLARLDSGIAERFFRLVERYGWFGLAWLEAILRLADHRRSEEEQRAEEEA